MHPWPTKQTTLKAVAAIGKEKSSLKNKCKGLHDHDHDHSHHTTTTIKAFTEIMIQMKQPILCYINGILTACIC